MVVPYCVFLWYVGEEVFRVFYYYYWYVLLFGTLGKPYIEHVFPWAVCGCYGQGVGWYEHHSCASRVHRVITLYLTHAVIGFPVPSVGLYYGTAVHLTVEGYERGGVCGVLTEHVFTVVWWVYDIVIAEEVKVFFL